MVGVVSRQLISPVVFFTRIFFFNIRISYFQEHQWAFAMHVFFLDRNVSSRNLPFCFFVSSKNQTSCLNFQQTGTWNLSDYSGCFSKFFPVFRSQEQLSRGVPQKYYSLTRVEIWLRKRKQESVICKFNKSCTVS